MPPRVSGRKRDDNFIGAKKGPTVTSLQRVGGGQKATLMLAGAAPATRAFQRPTRDLVSSRVTPRPESFQRPLAASISLKSCRCTESVGPCSGSGAAGCSRVLSRTMTRPLSSRSTSADSTLAVSIAICATPKRRALSQTRTRGYPEAWWCQAMVIGYRPNEVAA